MKLSGSEALVYALEQLGVEHIFGLPGDHTHLYDAVYKSKIKHTLVRHEQCAAHMADGYARISGKVGVCDGANGPGVTNMLTGIAEAYTDGIPVVAIASNIRLGARGRGCFQEVDQLNIFRPVTKEVIDVQVAARIPEYVRRAFQIAVTGKPGPVLLNLPLDVIREVHDYSDSELYIDPLWGTWPALRVRPEADLVSKTTTLLVKSTRPVLWCGGGVMSANAWEEVSTLARAHEIPVVTTFMGKGSIAENDWLCIGTVGQLGKRAANDFIQEADLIIAIGSRFSNLDTASGKIPGSSTTIVQINIDPSELGNNAKSDLNIWSDARLFVADLINDLKTKGVGKIGTYKREDIEKRHQEWLATYESFPPTDDSANNKQLHPGTAIHVLNETLKKDDVLVCDSGFNQIWGGQHFTVGFDGRGYIGPRGFGVMGFALPAAMGAKIAAPNKRFVALCGDGGFAMVIQELETAARHDIPVVVVVLNNRNLEYIKQAQRQNFQSRFISVDFQDTDFAAIAVNFGCDGVRVRTESEFRKALQRALVSNKPTVIDVVTPESAKPDRYI